MKNYDKFKNMSIDKMAEIMQGVANCDNYVATTYCKANKECSESFKEWLQADAE